MNPPNQTDLFDSERKTVEMDVEPVRVSAAAERNAHGLTPVPKKAREKLKNVRDELER